MYKTMKTLIIRAVAAALVLMCLCAAVSAERQPALYRAVTVGESRMMTEPGDWGETVTYLKKNRGVEILAVEPNFLYVRSGEFEGWIYRSRVKNVRRVDPVNTPPYGVVPFGYMACAQGDAPVMAEPDARSKLLITLHDGARLGIIGFENGWAKVIYKRQYGYLNTSFLRDITAVKAAPEEGTLKAPLAVYTSYYKTDDTEANQGRMMNIKVACEKLSSIVLQPGDKLDFNAQIGPYTLKNGYFVAPILTEGKMALNYGGGTCQVSSTLYNVLLQLPGITVLKRRAHGDNGASYLPHGVDAAVGNSALNLIYRNDYDFPVRVDASAQDGALYMSMWREDDFEKEMEVRRFAEMKMSDEAEEAVNGELPEPEQLTETPEETTAEEIPQETETPRFVFRWGT